MDAQTQLLTFHKLYENRKVITCPMFSLAMPMILRQLPIPAMKPYAFKLYCLMTYPLIWREIFFF